MPGASRLGEPISCFEASRHTYHCHQTPLIWIQVHANGSQINVRAETSSRPSFRSLDEVGVSISHELGIATPVRRYCRQSHGHGFMQRQPPAVCKQDQVGGVCFTMPHPASLHAACPSTHTPACPPASTPMNPPAFSMRREHKCIS